MAAAMPIKAARRAPQMDDNSRVGLRDCQQAAEASQAGEQSHQDRLRPAERAPARIGRPPIRAVALGFSGRANASSVPKASVDAPQQQVTVNQPQRLPSHTLSHSQRQPQQQAWPTSLISSLVSSRTKLISSKAVPITRNGVHQSIRLHRNSLLEEESAGKQAGAPNDIQIRAGEPSRLKHKAAAASSSLNHVRRPTAPSAAGRANPSPASTNSRVRQAALYARRQYHITPKPATSQVAAAELAAHTRPQASSQPSCLPLRLASAAAQSSRLTAARSAPTGRSPLLSPASPAATATLTTGSGKSSLVALSLIQRAPNNSSTTPRREQQLGSSKPLKSASSKFSLTSSTSSLTLTAVKRVKPSEPAHQPRLNNKVTCCDRKAPISGHLGGSSPHTNPNKRESFAGSAASRHFLSARRGLSGNALAAANRKPIARANRNAASNAIANVNTTPTNAKNIIAKNASQTNGFGRRPGHLPAPTPAPTGSDNNNQPSTLIGDRLLSAAAAAEGIAEAPAYLVENKTSPQTLANLLPDIPQTDNGSEGTTCPPATTSDTSFSFNIGGSYAPPNNRQTLDETHQISAENIDHLVDYKPNTVNSAKMVDSQQDKQSALNAGDLVSNKSNRSNSVMLVKGPLGLHLSDNIGETRKLSLESVTTNGRSFAEAISNRFEQVENLPPKKNTSRCQRDVFLHREGAEYLNDQTDGKEPDIEAHENVEALISDGQNNCCDLRSETESTDSRKSMDCQEEDVGKQEAKSDDELLSSSVSMQRTNSLDSNLEAIDEHMVLGSPLVTPPPSELDVDEPEIIHNNDVSPASVGEIKIETTKPDNPHEKKLQSSTVPAVELSIPIRTEPITDYYDLEPRPFARGKFAQVKRCIHKSSQKCFAAKCIKKRRRLIDIRHEILLEIEALKLSYYTNHIVKLYEVYETSTEMILVLEMANGGELQRVLDDEEAIEEEQVKRMVRQILDGLTHLHDNDIAHLDIKPQNLLLTESFPKGEVKLCDFGISRRITKDCEIREICGTPDYVAPEILRYDPISLATDIWSLGVLTYVLLSGYSPFGSENKQQTFCNITQAALDFPSEIFDKISKEAIDFMQKLIVREPSKRLTSRQARNHSWLNS